MLQCNQCDGAVTQIEATETDPLNWTERHQCVECGGLGAQSMRDGETTLTGCLEVAA